MPALRRSARFPDCIIDHDNWKSTNEKIKNLPKILSEKMMTLQRINKNK